MKENDAQTYEACRLANSVFGAGSKGEKALDCITLRMDYFIQCKPTTSRRDEPECSKSSTLDQMSMQKQFWVLNDLLQKFCGKKNPG